jgi:hypothetical protein
MIVDHVIVQCVRCKSERVVWPDAHIRGTQAILDWVKASPIASCLCGADRCNLKLHLLEPPEQNELLAAFQPTQVKD